MSNVVFRQHGDENIMCYFPINEDIKINIWTGIKFMKVVRQYGSRPWGLIMLLVDRWSWNNKDTFVKGENVFGCTCRLKQKCRGRS